MKKIKLTTETKINFLGKKLFRIEAIVDFNDIKKGTKGGWVETIDNISDNAWVSGDAKVYGNARVSGDAWETSPIQIQGSCHFINESDIGFISIGCINMSFDEWLKKYKEIGIKHNYSENQIKEYENYINLIIGINKLRKK